MLFFKKTSGKTVYAVIMYVKTLALFNQKRKIACQVSSSMTNKRLHLGVFDTQKMLSK